MAARFMVAVLLVLVLPLSGAGRDRGFASTNKVDFFGAPGMICHAHRGGSPAPRPRHGCCEDCALGTLAPPAGPPAPVASARTAHRLQSEVARLSIIPTARARTPRLARGPPGA